MHPIVLVPVGQDQEFGQAKKVSIPQRQLFELPFNDTCKGTKYPYGVPIEGVKKRRYEKELFSVYPIFGAFNRRPNVCFWLQAEVPKCADLRQVSSGP